MLRLLQRLGLGPRCARCGLRIFIEQNNARARFSLDPNEWSNRCKAIAIAGEAPFECPHLRRAAHAAVNPQERESLW